jgi:hypothetical protein
MQLVLESVCAPSRRNSTKLAFSMQQSTSGSGHSTTRWQTWHRQQPSGSGYSTSHMLEDLAEPCSWYWSPCVHQVGGIRRNWLLACNNQPVAVVIRPHGRRLGSDQVAVAIQPHAGGLSRTTQWAFKSVHAPSWEEFNETAH